MIHEFLSEITTKLPAILTRNDIKAHFGSLISKGYLANLDSKGFGPKRCRIGNKVAYKREDFVEWLSSRMRDKEAISTH